MNRRTFEEMVSYFNQTVADMDIDRKYKMELLGMITAILQRHDEDMKHAPTIEERKTGKWEQENPFTKPRCSECGEQCFGLHAFDYTLTPYCPNCGAEMDCYMVNSSMFHMSDIMREVVNVPTAWRKWLHDILQDAIDAGIITETQASRLMDRITEDNT